MLEEPARDAARAAADRALLQALRARLALAAAAPDAEALALRELLAAARPEEAEPLRAVWGRLSGAAPLVWGGAAAVLAADRFGLDQRRVDRPEQAIDALTGGGRALLDIAGGAWWGRLLARPGLRVTGALPDTGGRAPLALLVEARPTGPTGDDRTFWVTDSGLSEPRIVEALAAAGLAAAPLAAAGGLKLFMLAGYVQPEDGRLADAPGGLSGVIGAAPIY